MSIILFIVYFSRLLFPHGDLHLRIEDLTQAITLYPDSIELYQARGDLYIQHEQYQFAEKDFEYCLRKELNTPLVLEGLSKSLGYQSRLDTALSLIDRAIEKDTSSLSALEWKARVTFLMKRFCDAGNLYEQLIHKVSHPSPALYLDAANAWDQCNTSEGQQRSVNILREGIERIGPLHVLYQELARKSAAHLDFENAIRFQTILVEKSLNKVPSLFQRAMVYEQAGNVDTAIQDLELALSLMSELPKHKSSVPAMRQLRSDIESNLKRLQN